MEKTQSLSFVFLTNILLCTIVSILIIGSLWTWQQYTTFQRESEILQKRMLKSYKTLIKTQVQKSVNYIEYNKLQSKKRLHDSIRQRVYDSHTAASHVYEKWKDKKSSIEIQTVIKDSLRAIRFNHGRGYFFIIELDRVNQLLTDLPELEVKNIREESIVSSPEIVGNFISLIKERGEGFHRYNWAKPDMPNELFPKVGFVKFFEPYNWIIGTGEYLDDFESKTKADILNYLETIRYEKDGYVFVTQWDGLDLVGPAKGRNMLGATDVNGVKIVQELISLAKADGGFLKYVLPKFKGKKPDPKLSYVQGIKDWKWYVGAGIYIDDIEKAINKKQRQMTRQVKKSLVLIIAVLFGVIALTYFFAKQTSRNTQINFERFAKFFNRGARKLATIDPGMMKYKEFKTLANSANDMIKARRIARSALIESEKKYRLIVENLNDLIIKLDCDKNLIFASPNYFALFDKSRDEILNQSFLSLCTTDDRDAVEKSLKDLDRPPNTSYHEEQVLTKSGWRWIAWSSRAIPKASGEPMEYVAIGRDITEKKYAELISKENQEWLQNILDSIQAGVIVIDPETHKILEANRAAIEMIGMEKDQIINACCHNYICPNDIGMCPVTDLGLRIEQSERVLIAADGERIPILKTVNRAMINEKEYLIESFLDLRDKKHLESMLTQAQKMEAIGTLAGGIAHDFNNILGGIFGHVQLAQIHLGENKKTKRHLGQIATGAQRASELVQQILTFSRQTEHQKLPVTVFVILKEALQLLRSSIPVSIEIKKDINSKAKIMADPSQIHQVIMNLCTNAFQAMKDAGGVLSVALHEVDMDEKKKIPGIPVSSAKYLKLEIGDTGYGMEKKTLKRIFDPYFTTKDIGEGTGLGLSTVDGIIKKHNGFIKVKSKLGEGSLFQVYLPIFKGDEAGKDLRRSEKQLVKGTEKLMLVDDEINILDTLKAILTIHGYKVSTFNNGRSALEEFRDKPENFDLIITDMTMPQMTGDKLSLEILKIRNDIPIIVCTGYHETFTEKEAIQAGVKRYIQKPVAGMDLLKIIRKLLDYK